MFCPSFGYVAMVGCATTCGVVNAASQGGNTLMHILLQIQEERQHLGLFAVGVVVMIVNASFPFMVVAVVEVAAIVVESYLSPSLRASVWWFVLGANLGSPH